MAFEGINLTDSKYIPQYAGQPLEAMERVGDDLQTRHYDNIAKLRQLELLGLQQAATTPNEADKAYIKGQTEGVQSALAEIAKTGGENATGKVGALATQYLGNEGLIKLKRNADQYRAQQDAIAKYGKAYVFNEKLTNDYLTKGSINPDGTYNDFMSTAQERLNYTKKQDELLEPFRADVSQGDLLGDMKTTLGAMGYSGEGDLANMPAYLKTTAIKKLTMDKMLPWIEKGGWDSYKDTAEYEQQSKVLGMSDEDIKNELISRAEAKVFQEVDKQWMSNKAFDFKAAQKAEGVLRPQGEQVPNTKIPVNITSGNYEDFLDKDREDTETTTDYTLNPNTGTTTTYVKSKGKYTGAAKGLEAERWDKLNESASLGSSVFGDGSFKPVNEKSTPEERTQAVAYAKAYEDLVKSRVEYRMKNTSFTTRSGEQGRSNADDLTTDVIDNIKNRVIYDETTGKIINPQDEDGNFSKELMAATHGDITNMKVTGVMDPENYIAKATGNEELADAFMVEVVSKEDPRKTRSLLISDKAYDPINQPAAYTNRAINRLYTGFNTHPGKEATVNIGGLTVKGKELIGNQMKNELQGAHLEAAQSMVRPTLVNIPGLGWVLADGAKGIMEYINDPNNSKLIRWEK